MGLTMLASAALLRVPPVLLARLPRPEREPAPAWLTPDPLTILWVWIGGALFLAALALVVWRWRHQPSRARLVGPGMLVVAMGLTCFVGEVVLRVVDSCFYGIPFSMVPSRFKDRDLGWRGKEVLGDLATKKFKILVLGDSITFGRGVSEEQLYYRVFARRVDAEIFVYAGGGYGTLQEYLALDRYFNRIRPDLVILQVCSNDLINNSWELERLCRTQNNLMVRPYLVDGKIIYRFPGALGRMRPLLASHSRLFYAIVTRLDKAEAALADKGILSSAERDMARKGIRWEPFRRAAATTRTIVRLIKKRVGPVPLLALPAETKGPLVAQLRKAVEKSGLVYVGEPAQRIDALKVGGARLTLDGHHWNAEGHRIVGEALAEAFARRGLCRDARLACSPGPAGDPP